MKELWFGCPNCYLAFYKDSEYRQHFGLVHAKKKFKLAGRIESAV